MNIIRQSPVLRLFIAGLATLFLVLGGTVHSRASQLSGSYVIIAGTKIAICDTESGGHDKASFSAYCDQCVLCGSTTLPAPETVVFTRAVSWHIAQYVPAGRSFIVAKIWPVLLPRGPPFA